MIKRDGRTDVIRQAAECLPSDFLVMKQFAVVLILNVTTDELHNNDYYVIILHRIFVLLRNVAINRKIV